MRSIRMLGALVLTLSCLVGAAHAQVFRPQSFTLENGLRVVVIENHRIPVVTHMVWYKAGSADEPRGVSGIAHFLEHLMFKGTETMAPGEFSRVVSRHGGSDNAFTSFDYTAYFQTVPSRHLGLMMRLEADRMANLRLDDTVVLPERDVILEERRQVVDSRPGSLFGEQMRASFFQHDPYRIPIIGWAHEMERLSTRDALDWYERHYAPNNAILVVSGDVTAEEVRRLARETYGKVPARPVPARVRVREPPHHAALRLTYESPQAAQPSLTRYYLAPSHLSGESGKAHALEVLAEILGGGPAGRLHGDLVAKEGIATGVSASYDGETVGPAIFGLGGAPRQGVTLETLEAAIDARIATLLEDGVGADELARAKERLVTEAVFARDSLRGPAHVLGRALAVGRTIEDVESWPARISAVTAEQVMEAARAVLRIENSITGHLKPKKTS